MIGSFGRVPGGLGVHRGVVDDFPVHQTGARGAVAPAHGRRLLVVEDDDGIARAPGRGLGAARGSPSPRCGPARRRSRPPSRRLRPARPGLPDLDGGEVCRRLRARTDVPIIVVTARSDELDRVLPPGDGRRRLRGEAVRLPGAGGPHPGGAAPHAGPVVTARRRGPASSGRSRSIARARRVWLERRGGRPHAQGVRPAGLPRRGSRRPSAPARTSSPTVWDEHWWGPTKTLDVHVAVAAPQARRRPRLDHHAAGRRLPVRPAGVNSGPPPARHLPDHHRAALAVVVVPARPRLRRPGARPAGVRHRARRAGGRLARRGRPRGRNSARRSSGVLADYARQRAAASSWSTRDGLSVADSEHLGRRTGATSRPGRRSLPRSTGSGARAPGTPRRSAPTSSSWPSRSRRAARCTAPCGSPTRRRRSMPGCGRRGSGSGALSRRRARRGRTSSAWCSPAA